MVCIAIIENGLLSILIYLTTIEYVIIIGFHKTVQSLTNKRVSFLNNITTITPMSHHILQQS